MFKRHVVVVENEALLRDLIGQSLESAGYRVSTAANTADAKRACEVLAPDAVVLDIELGPGPNGFDFAEYLMRTRPDVGVVFLTNLPDPRFAGRAPHGISKNSAYLRKSQLMNSHELQDAIEAVLKESISVRHRHDLDSTRPLAVLSRKQIEVLFMLSQGQSNSQIAENRGTSIRAVEGMVSRIFEALAIDPAANGNARVEAARTYMSAIGSPILEH